QGSAAPQRPPAVWVCQLGSPDGKDFKVIGNPFQVKGVLANVDDLKEAIEKKEKLTIAASKIDIYSKEDGRWVKEDKMSESLRFRCLSILGCRPAVRADCYGYMLPAGAAGAA
ncbi:unnamed protein product, partial [Effrenium voratum]